MPSSDVPVEVDLLHMRIERHVVKSHIASASSDNMVISCNKHWAQFLALPFGVALRKYLCHVTRIHTRNDLAWLHVLWLTKSRLQLVYAGSCTLGRAAILSQSLLRRLLIPGNHEN